MYSIPRYRTYLHNRPRYSDTRLRLTPHYVHHLPGLCVPPSSGTFRHDLDYLLTPVGVPNDVMSGKRRLHVGLVCRKEETSVEKTAQVLKDLKSAPESTSEALSVPARSVLQRVVAELKHYYHGLRLFLIETKISVQLLRRVLDGNTLSRRERKQLVRTSGDVFRLLPFLVFIIVPFMEFLLPVALKLFPNMLPSTFREERKEQEKLRTQLKLKLEMAKFLQETIQDSSMDWKNRTQNKSLATDFGMFIEKIRAAGGMASRDEILKYSKLFEDEITMDSLSRPQLGALCRLLELSTIGTDNFLRFQLRMKLRDLHSDDKMIIMEGINTLTATELQVACRERGMRALGMSEERLKAQLQQWLDLHLNDKVPTTLLLLSRAMYLPEETLVEDQLKVIISSLSDTTAEKAKLNIAVLSGEKVDNLAKLEVIRQEEQAIKQEQKQMEQQKEAEAAELFDSDLVKEVPGIDDVISDETASPVEDLKEDISAKDLEDIESAIETLAEEKHFDIEKDELDSLKEDVSEYEEDLRDLKEVIVSTGGHQEDIVETKAAERLGRKLNAMIGRMDAVISDLHTEDASISKDIHMKERSIEPRSPDLQQDQHQEAARSSVMDEIKERKHSVISINELVLAMKRLQKIPDEERLEMIARVLDEDQDGIIEVEHILRVVDELGQQNVKLPAQQVRALIRVLKDEMMIEDEEKLKMKEHKDFIRQLDQDGRDTEAKNGEAKSGEAKSGETLEGAGRGAKGDKAGEQIKQ